MDISTFENNGIDKFLNTISLANIPLINVITIDNLLYGRFDIVMNKYYLGQMQYIPLILAFNRITDTIELKIGTIIELPDIDILLKQILFTKIIDDENPSDIPGINKTTNSQITNKTIAISKSNKTTASPKLKIPLTKVSYDKNSGILKF